MKRQLINLYALQALVKGFWVFYLVLLPVFYAQRLIDAAAVGIYGTLFIVALIVGAVAVARWLHTLATRQLLLIAATASAVASLGLLLGIHNQGSGVIAGSYVAMGLAVGSAMSGINVLAAHVTTRGERYGSLAKLAMLTDIVRIASPLFVLAAVSTGQIQAAIGLIVLAAVLFLLLATTVPDLRDSKEISIQGNRWLLSANRRFRSILTLEFLDSFASSQLFVFLPLLFLAKGYDLQDSLALQVFVFIGYLLGRGIVGYLAKRQSGIRAVAYAEIGMVITIALLITIPWIGTLYLLSLFLGVCARGTSPVIKALALDSLDDGQLKRGSALHVIAGDGGSALGQLAFGLLFAVYGATAPFGIAAALAALAAVWCVTRLRN